MSDLVSIVLSLRPLELPAERPAFPLWWGRAAQQCLLQAVAARDPALAEEMHAPNRPRFYTVSNLLGRFPKRQLDPAQSYALRMTGLTAAMSAALLDLTAPGGPFAPGAAAQLDFAAFEVQAVAFQPQEQPWAAQGSYRVLAERLVDAPPRRFAFHLASPLAFHSGGGTQPLPLPDLFFGNLLERWNAFAPLAFPVEMRRYAAEMLVVSRFDLQSRAIHIKEGGLRVGAVGQVEFSARNADRYWLGMLGALAAFAQFSGVGSGTAQGLGQCRSLDFRF